MNRQAVSQAVSHALLHSWQSLHSGELAKDLSERETGRRDQPWLVGLLVLLCLGCFMPWKRWRFEKSESSCKIGYSFIRFGFAQSTIYASPERCLAQTTWPCPPERRWIVFGRTAWTTLPQRRGSPHWSRGGSSSWSPCARFSGAHLQFEREREQTMIEMESTWILLWI